MAIDEPNPDANHVGEILDAIPDAHERAIEGRAQGHRGETVPLDDL